MKGWTSLRASDARVAEVIVDLHVPDVDRVFDYAIPGRLRGEVVLGRRVLVPFGHRSRVEGYVVGLAAASPRSELKEIHAVLDAFPILSESSIAVSRWMQARYLCPLVQALQCFLPPGSRLRGSRVIHSLTQKGFEVPDSAKARAAMADLERRAPKQAHLLRLLVSAGKPLTAKQATRAAGSTRAPLKGLVEKGLVSEVDVAIERDPLGAAGSTREPLQLNVDQERALHHITSAMETEGARKVVLQGVTGSGKTEVYLQAVAQAVKSGKGAVLLVPEIALTSQTIASFRSFFGANLAVLHSRLSLGERYDQWRRVHRGQVSIVVGARSAIFAPVHRLSLIVLDEEHEPSYKQEESPRYHARDVAWARAREEGAVLVLGSATPAMETRFDTDQGRAVNLRLPRRVDERPLPAVHTVDMRQELAAGNRTMFSRRLKSLLGAALGRGEQAILFMNRRGFASFLLCRECGYVPRCESCEVSLTFHQPSSLRCHYCDGHVALPQACPQCGGPYLRPFGGGTQRVESELKQAFPAVRPTRMDVDTTGRKGAHARILGAFGAGRHNVLIGTQMIAKGLHFPGVTLVGVISADTGLHFPDYRAAERTFQLLTQVAGRAGRGTRAGEVVIQTYSPDHYAVQTASTHDYDGFYRVEQAYRRRAGYPPFAALIRCLWSGEIEEEVIRSAESACRPLEQLPESRRPDLLGPCPAPLSRLKGRYRWHVLLRGSLEGVMAGARLVKQADAAAGREGVRLAVDVDPMGLL